jgi:PIN domain nuclease of toxin-antitoxin system
VPYVVDASAVVALLRDEPGAERLEELLGAVAASFSNAAFLSTVNLAEVYQQLGPKLPEKLIGAQDSVIGIAEFTREHARAAAAMYESTRDVGLSLGDRACLALAKTMGLSALTADRGWAEVDVGVDVQLIR